jgi:hypothetical protein
MPDLQEGSDKAWSNNWTEVTEEKQVVGPDDDDEEEEAEAAFLLL